MSWTAAQISALLEDAMAAEVALCNSEGISTIEANSATIKARILGAYQDTLDSLDDLAYPPVIFSTTFADSLCAEWDGTTGPVTDAAICQAGDGITSSGNNATYPERITSAANFAGGGGGKGQRHSFGDGTNQNGQGLNIGPGISTVSEFWARAYLRYSAGQSWLGGDPHYTKDFYVSLKSPNDKTTFILGISGNRINFNKYQLSFNVTGLADSGWPTFSDGNFHCVEWHAKMDTNGSNGQFHLWLDSVLQITITDLDWGTGALGAGGWQGWLQGSNQEEPTNSGAIVYRDYDDIAVSVVGQIGPVNPLRLYNGLWSY